MTFLKRYSFLFVFIFCLGSFAQKVDFLFVLYDRGETNGLKPVAARLEEAKYTVKMVCLGQASEIFKDDPRRIPLELWDSRLVPATLKTWKRDHQLSPDIVSKIQEDVQPQVVVTGMASAAQAQMLNWGVSQRAKTIAFYDNFDPVTGKEYVQEFLKVVGSITTYLVPSSDVADSFKSLPERQAAALEVVGQPALEDWDKVFAETDTQALRDQLSLPTDKQVVLFVGGYDDSYPPYLKMFIQGMKERPDLQGYITYHPSAPSKGQMEREAAQGVKNVRVIEPADKISTAQLSTIVNVLACHKSTVGAQAAYKGVPVIFLAGPEHMSFLIDKKIATRADSVEDFIAALTKALAQKEPISFEALGIPQNASQKIVDYLKGMIS
jgi:hypothetical protein